MSERLRNRIKQELLLLSVAVIAAKKKARDKKAEQMSVDIPNNNGHYTKARIPTLQSSMDKHQVAITTLLLPHACSLELFSELLISMMKTSVDGNKVAYEQALTHLGQRLELALQKYNFAMVQASFSNLRQLLTLNLLETKLIECGVLNLLKLQKDIFHVLLLVITYAVQPASPNAKADLTVDSGRILHDKVSVLCSVARDGVIHIIRRYAEVDLQLRTDTGMMTVDHSLKMIAQQWSLRLLAETMIKTHHCFPVSSALHCIAEDIEFGMETN